MLAENGLVIMNTIAAIEGPNGRFLRAEHLEDCPARRCRFCGPGCSQASQAPLGSPRRRGCPHPDGRFCSCGELHGGQLVEPSEGRLPKFAAWTVVGGRTAPSRRRGGGRQEDASARLHSSRFWCTSEV
jgi:hypothetical protein